MKANTNNTHGKNNLNIPLKDSSKKIKKLLKTINKIIKT